MIRALASIGAVQVLILLVALVRAKLLSNWLGPAGFGIMSTIDQVVLTVVQVGAFSLPSTALRFLSRSHSEGASAFRASFGTFLRALSLLALGLVLLLSALLAWRPALLGAELVPYRSELATALLTVPAVVLNILFVNTLAAAQAPGTSATLGFLVACVLAAASIGGAWAGGLGGLYAALAGAGVVTTFATLLFLRRRLGLGGEGARSSLADTLRANPEIATQSAFVWSALSAYSLALFASRYVVLSVLGDVQAGRLQAQLGLAATLGAVVAPMSALYFMPLVNRNLPVREKIAAADAFASKVTLLLILGGLPIVLFPGTALRLLFSPEFTPGAGLLFVFVLWQILFHLATIYLQLLIGLGDAAVYALISGLAYLAAVLLLPLLVPATGVAGAGLALAIAMVVALAGAAARLRRRFGVTIDRIVWGRAGGGVAVVALGAALFATSSETSLAGIAVRCVYAAGAVALLWHTLRANERHDLIRMLPGRRRGDS